MTKSLLLFETKEQTFEKYRDSLENTPWDITHIQGVEKFLETLQGDTFDLIIVEEAMLPDDVLTFLFDINVPLIISTSKDKFQDRNTISRDFSQSELINAIGKASFLKAVSIKGPVEKNFEGPEDDPVVLEPVFDGDDDEAVILTPEENDEPVRSSWEIPEKEEEDSNPQISSPEENGEKKKDIFDRIDEIDSILTSLSLDIENGKTPEKKKEAPSEAKPGFTFGDPDPEIQAEKTILQTEPSDNADFLFDDDYEPDVSEDTETEEKNKNLHPDFNSGMANDFEAILKDKPLEVKKVESDEFEIEQYEDKFSKELEKDDKESEPEIKTPPVSNEDISEIAKKEIKNWLETNGRQIIKEIVLEQLSKLSGKDG